MSCCNHVDHAPGDPCLIVCAPTSVTYRRVRECPTCKRRRRFVVKTFVWYDPIWTCCGCGDSWSSGVRFGRPARRGWRIEATRKARSEWVAAPSRNEADRMQRRMLAPYVERVA